MSIDSRKLVRKLDSMSGIDLRKGVGRALKTVQGEAKLLCPGDSEELRSSIMTTVERIADSVIGKCFTDKRYGPYVELGTGPKGEQNHEGISPAISPAYTQSPWWIHESQVDKELAEKYHWFKITTKDGVFYQCSGQPAHPFLYPALKNNEEKVTDQIAEACRKDME